MSPKEEILPRLLTFGYESACILRQRSLAYVEAKTMSLNGITKTLLDGFLRQLNVPLLVTDGLNDDILVRIMRNTKATNLKFSKIGEVIKVIINVLDK